MQVPSPVILATPPDVFRITSILYTFGVFKRFTIPDCESPVGVIGISSMTSSFKSRRFTALPTSSISTITRLVALIAHPLKSKRIIPPFALSSGSDWLPSSEIMIRFVSFDVTKSGSAVDESRLLKIIPFPGIVGISDPGAGLSVDTVNPRNMSSTISPP